MEASKKLWEVVTLRTIALLEANVHTSLRHESLPSEPPVLWLDYVLTARSLEVRGLLEVIASLDVQAKLHDAETSVLGICLKHRLLYSVPEDISPSESALQEFAYTSGVLNIWPYWREASHSIFRQMELPMPPLPVYRVGRGIESTASPAGHGPASKSLSTPDEAS